MDRGVDIITIQTLLGHSTVVVTMRYTHARDDRAASAVALLESGKALEKGSVCDAGVTAKTDLPAAIGANHGVSVN